MDPLKRPSIEAPHIVRLKSMPHAFGELVVAESGILPFEPRRTYFVRGIPAGARRGGHAHFKTSEAIMAFEGRFKVIVECVGRLPQSFILSDPREALLIPPLCWISLMDFSDGAAFLVVASEPYDEADYMRDRESFDKLARGA